MFVCRYFLDGSNSYFWYCDCVNLFLKCIFFSMFFRLCEGSGMFFNFLLGFFFVVYSCGIRIEKILLLLLLFEFECEYM